jgi:hypothetical protein
VQTLIMQVAAYQSLQQGRKSDSGHRCDGSGSNDELGGLSADLRPGRNAAVRRSTLCRTRCWVWVAGPLRAVMVIYVALVGRDDHHCRMNEPLQTA